MKITNIILGVVCALVIGLAAFLYVQKSNADKRGAALDEQNSALQSELGQMRAKYEELSGKHQELQTNSSQMAAQLKDETGRARAMSADLLRLQRDHAAMTTKLQQLSTELRSKEEEVDRLAEARRALISRFTEELRNREGMVGADGPSLELSGSSLFQPGQVELSEQGREALRQMGGKLKDMGDKLIRVEGHTDSVPVRRQKGMYQTNWEVSMARALNVVRFLVDEMDIPPERLEAVGMSQYHPIADNSTAEGREKNRRIVIKFRPLPPTPAAVPLPGGEPPPAAVE